MPAVSVGRKWATGGAGTVFRHSPVQDTEFHLSQTRFLCVLVVMKMNIVASSTADSLHVVRCIG